MEEAYREHDLAPGATPDLLGICRELIVGMRGIKVQMEYLRKRAHLASRHAEQLAGLMDLYSDHALEV